MAMRDKIEHAIQNQPCTVKDLKNKFGGDRGADRKVMEAVDQLVHEAVICQRQGVFFTVRSGRADKALLCKVVKLGKNFAFVMLEDGTSDIFIPGRFTRGAMPGDKVLVEKFAHPRVEGSDEGEILAVLEEKNSLVGTMHRMEGRLKFVPDDCPAISMQVMRDCEGSAKDGDKVAVEILLRGSRQEDHRVGVAMRFGSCDEAKRCAKALLYAQDIRNRFPDKVRDEAKKLDNAEVSAADCEGRMDLRALPIFTIDSAKLEVRTGIVARKELESTDALEENLTQQLGLVDYAYVLYVEGEPVAATTFPGAIEQLLEQLKKGYITDSTVDCYFVENVEVKQEYVDQSLIMNLGYIAEKLNATKAGEVTYTVKSGDVWSLIAEENGMTNEELLALNPGYDISVLHTGDVLTISRAVPYLTVVNVERQSYLQDVAYSVEYVDDPDMYQGDYEVLSKGVYGKADVTANVTVINGTETAREVVSSVTLKEPVAERQARGTKERPTWFPTGSFRWPCYGVITSYFGGRNTGISGASSYHEAIDIANSYGTPIYAADGGTVIYSGWNGGLGYCVKIDHGNGFITWYGHNSDLYVSVGDHVYKGQTIAAMGSTGISSGSHCDFRIQRNGTMVDPLNYLP